MSYLLTERKVGKETCCFHPYFSPASGQSLWALLTESFNSFCREVGTAWGFCLASHFNSLFSSVNILPLVNPLVNPKPKRLIPFNSFIFPGLPLHYSPPAALTLFFYLLHLLLFFAFHDWYPFSLAFPISGRKLSLLVPGIGLSRSGLIYPPILILYFITEPPAGIDNHWKESSYPENLECELISRVKQNNAFMYIHCLKRVIKNIENLIRCIWIISTSINTHLGNGLF